MKIYWLSLFAGLVTLLSFQNCQKSPYQDEINTLTKNAVSVTSPNKINLSEQRVSQVDFLTQDAETIVKAGNTFSILVNKTEQVDLATGQIKVISDTSSDVQTYCLTESLKNELLNIVKSSSVCKGTSTQSGEVCVQSFKMPYARIITSGDQFDLGSAPSGCSSSAVDLCDDGASLLKGFAANLKSKLTTLVCPQ